MPVTILAALPLSDQQRLNIVECGDVEIVEVPPQPSPGVLEEMASRAEVWFGPRIRPNVIEAARNLKWIQLMGAGVDRYMFPELAGSDILVTNLRGMHADTIADHVMMMVLAFARNLRLFSKSQEARRWDRGEVRPLAGTRMAVVGLGSIGRAVARRASAFGMTIVGTVRQRRDLEGVDEVFGPEGLMEAITNADWVVLCCPLTNETRGLIGEEQLKAMGTQAVLINIARGKVVDEQALIRALRDGWIAGAGLDVFEEEPLPESSPLWDMPNVIATPHISGSVGSWQDYLDQATQVFCENLRRYLKGESLINVVDKAAGY